MALRAGVPGLDAVEFLTADGMDLVLAAGRAPAPFRERAAVHVLAEAVGPDADSLVEALAEAVAGVEGVRDAAVAVGDVDRKRLWALREAHTEVLAPLRPVKLDVAVPVPALAAFVAGLPAVTASRLRRPVRRSDVPCCSATSPRATCT